MKGQIEIMGLIVIVILVAVGFFVYMVFVLNAPDEEPVKEYAEDQLAQSFLSSLVKTQTPCGFSFDKLVQDCSLERNIDCLGKDSCHIVNDTVIIILNKTLDEWGYPYNLSIKKLNLEYLNKKCNATSDRGTQGMEMITLYGRGDVVLTLDICR